MIPDFRASWLIVLLVWSCFQSLVWGQLETYGGRTRSPATRVQTPSAVVQASANLGASKSGSEPIPMKSSSENQPARIAAPRSPWSATLSTVFSLLLVMFLFLGATFVLRKSQPKQFQKLPKDVVEVLGRTSIAPRQNLVVVRFGSKLVLVSQQPGETRTIAEIQDTNEVGRLAGLCESHRPESISNSFRDVLQQVVQSKPERAA
jgi:flagellar biogenesis protein FliO